MDFFADLDAVRRRWNVLEHPFYTRWSAGELTLDELLQKRYLALTPEELQRILAEHSVPVATAFEPGMRAGSVAFLDAGPGSAHRDFVTNAWAHKPVADFLGRLAGYGGH